MRHAFICSDTFQQHDGASSPDRRSNWGMRVDRTFAFVDLCGFTRFTESQGDEEAVYVLTGFRAVLREVASDHGVRIGKWLGDGAMLVAPEPNFVVEGILELQRRVDIAGVGLPVRCGAARGRVILFEGDDYIGSPVNLAARLCDSAAPYEVLASADLSDVVPPTALYTEASLVIPGFIHPVPVLRVTSKTSGEPEPLPPSLR